MEKNKKQIRVQVRDKVAELVDKEQFIVGGNDDYDVVFDFDGAWDDYPAKTALFVYGETVVEKVMIGNVCEGVAVNGASVVGVGVYSGEQSTTTPAFVNCKQSIRDLAKYKTPVAPSEDVYEQIIALLNQYIAEVNNIVAKAVEDYLVANPPEAAFSPIVSVAPIENGHRVTITDINKSHTFDVMNGEKGERGEKGVRGEQGVQGDRGEKGEQGIQGEAGYTPQRGVDYWTPQDEATIQNYIDKKTALSVATADKLGGVKSISLPSTTTYLNYDFMMAIWDTYITLRCGYTYLIIAEDSRLNGATLTFYAVDTATGDSLDTVEVPIGIEFVAPTFEGVTKFYSDSWNATVDGFTDYGDEYSTNLTIQLLNITAEPNVLVKADGTMVAEVRKLDGADIATVIDVKNAVEGYQGGTESISIATHSEYAIADEANIRLATEVDPEALDVGTIDLNAYYVRKNGKEISTEEYVEKSKAEHERRITQLERHISQDYFVTDDSIAYEKSVPADACPYAQLNILGGMTYKCNNLFPTLPWVNQTVNGVTFTLDEDGVYHISGTATEKISCVFDMYLPAGKYSVSLNHNEQVSTSLGTVYMYAKGANGGEFMTASSRHSVGSTLTTTTTVDLVALAFTIEKRFSGELTVAPMFNAGDYIPYEPYYEGFGDSKVTEIKSHGANLLPILPWANQTVNGVTFTLDESGVYHLSGTSTTTMSCLLDVKLPVGKYTLSLNNNKMVGTTFAVYVVARSADNDWKMQHASHHSYAYTTITTTAEIVDVMIAIMEGTNCDGLTIAPMLNEGDYIPYKPYREPISYPIPAEIQAINGYGKDGFVIDLEKQMSAYEGEENPLPVPLDPIIEVEGGGRLEFVNEYKNAVPSSISYLLKEGSI